MGVLELKFKLNLSLIFRDIKCYYDYEKMLFSFSVDSYLYMIYLAKMQHAYYCGSIKKKSDFFLTICTISRLNCPLLPDSVPVELH